MDSGLAKHSGPEASTQKIRRNQIDRWQECDQIKLIKTSSGHPIVVSKVASRGEPVRDHFCGATLINRTCLSDGKILPGDIRRQSPVQGRRGSRDPSRETIKKSVSVPENLKGISDREKSLESGLCEEKILKRSSSSLVGISSGKPTLDRKYVPEHPDVATLRPAKAQNSKSFREDETRLSSALKKYSFSFTNRKISFGSKTLPKNCTKTTSSTKKSVSFSSDTNLPRTAIHEAKFYRKGVLQDSSANEKSGKTVSPLWEAPPGGLQALLKAAREADDEALRKIITGVEKFGSGNMDLNFKDSSGRTVTSYIAGNGSTDILQATLSFTGIDPNIPDNEGNTPLHFAAQAGQTDCLNMLLQRCPGIEVDTRNNLGFTPLMKAALQGRAKCAKILLFAGANPTLRDYGRGFRADQWARFCGRYVCAEVIERFARHRLLEKTTSCRWGSEPELAAKVLQGKVIPIPTNPHPSPSMGIRSRLRRVFRTTSGPDRSFSLVTQLTSVALCASSAALPKPSDVPPIVKSLLRPLSVPQLRITLVAPSEVLDRSDKCVTNFPEKIENTVVKPPRVKKKSK